MLYVDNDREDKVPDLINFIASLNYTMYWHLAPLLYKNNYFFNAENIFGNIVSVNMICIPMQRQVDIT